MTKRPTVGELHVMLKGFIKAAETRDKAHEDILHEIKQDVKEGHMHTKETKEQVYDVKGKVMRIQDKILEMDAQIDQHRRDIGRNKDLIDMLRRWKWYLAGGAALSVFVAGAVAPLVYQVMNDNKIDNELSELLTEYGIEKIEIVQE